MSLFNDRFWSTTHLTTLHNLGCFRYTFRLWTFTIASTTSFALRIRYQVSLKNSTANLQHQNLLEKLNPLKNPQTRSKARFLRVTEHNLNSNMSIMHSTAPYMRRFCTKKIELRFLWKLMWRPESSATKSAEIREIRWNSGMIKTSRTMPQTSEIGVAHEAPTHKWKILTMCWKALRLNCVIMCPESKKEKSNPAFTLTYIKIPKQNGTRCENHSHMSDLPPISRCTHSLTITSSGVAKRWIRSRGGTYSAGGDVGSVFGRPRAMIILLIIFFSCWPRNNHSLSNMLGILWENNIVDIVASYIQNPSNVEVPRTCAELVSLLPVNT